MKDKKDLIKRIFSFAEVETGNKSKISRNDLLNCPIAEMMCKFHLSIVDTNIIESEKLREEKNYLKSIEKLRSAFTKSTELNNHPCSRCTQSYQMIIIDMLENTQNELSDLSSGIFGNKKHKKTAQYAGEVLQEIKSAGMNKGYYLNESKDRYLGNYLN